MKYLILVFVFLLCGCSANQQELEKAQSTCIEHEGIYEISIFVGEINVYCKDGYSAFVTH